MKYTRPKHTHKTKSKPQQTCKFKNCSHVCAYQCAQLSYTIQHRTVRIIFPSNLQTIIITMMLSTGGGVIRTNRCICIPMNLHTNAFVSMSDCTSRIAYDTYYTIQYIYVCTKADKMASLI